MSDYNEGVFAGVMGALENLGYEKTELKITIRNILITTMNWTAQMTEKALDEVDWVFVE